MSEYIRQRYNDILALPKCDDAFDLSRISHSNYVVNEGQEPEISALWNLCIIVLLSLKINLEVIVEDWWMNCNRFSSHPTFFFEIWKYLDGIWKPGSNPFRLCRIRRMESLGNQDSAGTWRNLMLCPAQFSPYRAGNMLILYYKMRNVWHQTKTSLFLQGCCVAVYYIHFTKSCKFQVVSTGSKIFESEGDCFKLLESVLKR